MQTIEKGNKTQKITAEKLIVEKVLTSTFQDKCNRAQLRQVLNIENQDDNKSKNSIFSVKELNKEDLYKRNLVAWIDVPKSETAESIQKRIEEYPDAGLQREIANHPIVTEEQQNAIDRDDFDFTLEMLAEKQLLKRGSDQEIVLDENGKKQFHATFFKIECDKHIIDSRTDDPSDTFTFSWEKTQELSEPSGKISDDSLPF